MRVATANDLKLSEPRGWRDRCVAGGEGGRPEAAGVTAARVRCSAWLGVGLASVEARQKVCKRKAGKRVAAAAGRGLRVATANHTWDKLGRLK